MSPHPTRSNRVYVEREIVQIHAKTPAAVQTCMLALAVSTGRTQPDRRLNINLQKARAKIAIGSLLGALEFNHVKQGSSVWHNRGGALSRQGDGASVVVRDRESLSHGEGGAAQQIYLTEYLTLAR